MPITVSGVFGPNATIEAGNVLSIPRANLPVLSSSDDNTDGAEVVFAVLEKLVNTNVPLTSGNIIASSSTTLVNNNQLRKTYNFVLTVGNVALSGLDVV